MRLAHAVRLGAWMMVGLNLLMALAAVGIFMRMAPAIALIIERNERSLQAGEEMMAALALADVVGNREDLRLQFKAALLRASQNITEVDERAALDRIKAVAGEAFLSDPGARQQLVSALVWLGQINREAMIRADRNAQQLGYAGAWGIVFMAACTFFTGLIFIHTLGRRVVRPLEEIHAVILAQRQGDTRRRCSGGEELSRDMREVFSGINEMLDQIHVPTLSHGDQGHKVVEQPKR